jgi:hypothetical protein
MLLKNKALALQHLVRCNSNHRKTLLFEETQEACEVWAEKPSLRMEIRIWITHKPASAGHGIHVIL